MLYRVHLAWAGFELATLVVNGTDCIGICKFNSYTMTTTTVSGIYVFMIKIGPQTINHVGRESIYARMFYKEFEHTKGAIRMHKSKATQRQKGTKGQIRIHKAVHIKPKIEWHEPY